MSEIFTFEKQKEWHGNPSLGYDCYMAKFGMYTVYVWGGENMENKWNFTVKGQYTGYCVDCDTPEKAFDYVREKHKQGKIR